MGGLLDRAVAGEFSIMLRPVPLNPPVRPTDLLEAAAGPCGIFAGKPEGALIAPISLF